MYINHNFDIYLKPSSNFNFIYENQYIPIFGPNQCCNGMLFFTYQTSIYMSNKASLVEINQNKTTLFANTCDL